MQYRIQNTIQWFTQFNQICFYSFFFFKSTENLNVLFVPVDEVKNSGVVIGIGVTKRLRLRSSFAHVNKLNIDDKTMTIATFIFAVSNIYIIIYKCTYE